MVDHAKLIELDLVNLDRHLHEGKCIDQVEKLTSAFKRTPWQNYG